METVNFADRRAARVASRPDSPQADNPRDPSPAAPAATVIPLPVRTRAVAVVAQELAALRVAA